MKTRDGDRSWIAVLGLWALFAVPFVVALVALSRARYFPVLDLAQTELRIRDVGSGNFPMVGLPGRIGGFLEGSHPGPLSFWALWPVYALLGSTAWAMTAAAAFLNFLAIGAALWIAQRRAGLVLLVAVGAVLGALVCLYGPSHLTQPWNPYLPMLWFVVFLLAVMSVLDEDLPMLPVAIFAGTFCVQTHISYAALVGGLGLVVAIVLALRFARAGADGAYRRRVLTWTLGGVALGVLLWLAPVVQELTNDRGNLTIIWEYFTKPPLDPIGPGRGVELLLVHLNPWRLLAGQDASGGSIVGGLVLLVIWLLSVIVPWKERSQPQARTLLRLDLVLGVAVVLGAASIGRIFGFVWYYLMLWGWSVCGLMLVAIGWSAALLCAQRLSVDQLRKARTGLVASLVTATIVFLAVFTVAASKVEAPEADVAMPLRTLVPETVLALDAGDIPGAGSDGRLLVTWTLTKRLGSLGYGLLSELERSGFDVGAVDALRVVTTQHRVRALEDATATVHLAQGDEVAKWRGKPEYKEVAFVDLRTSQDRARYKQLRREAIAQLHAAGLDDVVENVDKNLFVAAYDPRNPLATKRLLEEMLLIGGPAAVFVGPPTLEL